MISLDEALKQILSVSQPLGIDRIAVADAAGRILAKPLKANINQPPFNASAMDGYAVIAGDISAGATLSQIGVSQAGAGFSGRVDHGQCVRIFTGAPVPEGADSVIMQEQTEVEGATISFSKAVALGQSIRKFGNDFKRGDGLIDPGTEMTPAAIGLATAGNNSKAQVFRQPRLALLGTGDELVPAGARVSPHQIVSSNSVGLAALFAPFCETCTDHGIAKDAEKLLTKKLKKILESDADIIVTTGGASVGDHDIVQPALKSLGVKMDFWKIAMRPGKPLMFGRIGKKLVFGLPGNPVSALVTASVVVLPALRALNGMPNPLGQRLRLPLSAPLPANGERRHFVRAVVSAKADGISAVRPIKQNDSAHLSSLATANALIVHMENSSALPAAEIVEVIPLWSNPL